MVRTGVEVTDGAVLAGYNLSEPRPLKNPFLNPKNPVCFFLASAGDTVVEEEDVIVAIVVIAVRGDKSGKAGVMGSAMFCCAKVGSGNGEVFCFINFSLF